jgi:hypothetical protein
MSQLDAMRAAGADLFVDRARMTRNAAGHRDQARGGPNCAPRDEPRPRAFAVRLRSLQMLQGIDCRADSRS